MPQNNVVVLNNDNFENEVMKADKPVMVDFWAEWCGPCRAMSPIVDEIADELTGKLKVCKLNVDEARETAQLYGVMSIPTLLFFKNGDVAAQQVGSVGKPALMSIINKL